MMCAVSLSIFLCADFDMTSRLPAGLIDNFWQVIIDQPAEIFCIEQPGWNVALILHIEWVGLLISHIVVIM